MSDEFKAWLREICERHRDALEEIGWVEVVRCEECKWHDIINQPYDIGYCRSICITVEDDWWCADGEGRE